MRPCICVGYIKSTVEVGSSQIPVSGRAEGIGPAQSIRLYEHQSTVRYVLQRKASWKRSPGPDVCACTWLEQTSRLSTTPKMASCCHKHRSLAEFIPIKRLHYRLKIRCSFFMFMANTKCAMPPSLPDVQGCRLPVHRVDSPDQAR